MDAPATASLAPNDTMRNGIATVKSELSFVHPVQPMQANVSPQRSHPAPSPLPGPCLAPVSLHTDSHGMHNARGGGAVGEK
jgi:hypothetical protein